MSQYSNELSNLSYTNKDFSTIYPELLSLAKSISYKWDPTVSDESDPGVVLLKLAALMADKLNYNIDKNVLETSPISVTQLGNARSLFDQCGYCMKYYVSATTDITLRMIAEPDYADIVDADNDPISIPSDDSELRYHIPRFTMIADSDNSLVYTLVDPVSLSNNQVSSTAKGIQGTCVQYNINGDTVITSSHLDSRRRIYFTETNVAENGIFIRSAGTDDISKGNDWIQVENLEIQDTNTNCYKFGITRDGTRCFIEFPSNIHNLIGEGLKINYILSDGQNGNAGRKQLCQLYSDELSNIIVTSSSAQITQNYFTTLTNENLYISNISATTNGCDPEDIESAYLNYERTKGTFDTLVSLRDYTNFVKNSPYASNGFVCDRTNDIQRSHKVVTRDLTGKVSTTFTVDKVSAIASDFYNPSISRTILEDALEPFDLCIYALQHVDNITSSQTYNESFKLLNNISDTSSAALWNLRSSLDEVKCIQHNFKNFEVEKPVILYNKYAIKASIIPNSKLETVHINEVKQNVKQALYKTLNASKIDFGEEVKYDVLYDTILNADSRIKTVLLDAITYNTYVCYYEASSLNIFELNGENLSSREQDIKNQILLNCVLSGCTPVFTIYDDFNYSVSQKAVSFGAKASTVADSPDYTASPEITQDNESVVPGTASPYCDNVHSISTFVNVKPSSVEEDTLTTAVAESMMWDTPSYLGVSNLSPISSSLELCPLSTLSSYSVDTLVSPAIFESVSEDGLRIVVNDKTHQDTIKYYVGDRLQLVTTVADSLVFYKEADEQDAQCYYLYCNMGSPVQKNYLTMSSNLLTLSTTKPNNVFRTKQLEMQTGPSRDIYLLNNYTIQNSEVVATHQNVTVDLSAFKVGTEIKVDISIYSPEDRSYITASGVIAADTACEIESPDDSIGVTYDAVKKQLVITPNVSLFGQGVVDVSGYEEQTTYTHTFNIDKNENVIFTAPNFILDNEFSSYCKFVSNVDISANSSHILKMNEYIVLFYKADSEDPGYSYYKYSEGSVVCPTFDIVNNNGPVNSLPTTLEEYIRNNCKFDKGMISNAQFNDIISNNLISDRYVLSGTRSIAVKKLNTVVVNDKDIGTSAIFWILNSSTIENGVAKSYLFSEDCLKTDTVTGTSYLEYSLKQGEYFIYTDSLMSTIYLLGTGTRITYRPTQSKANFDAEYKWSCPSVSYDELLSKGFVDYLQDKWFYCSRSDKGYSLIATEMQYIQLGEGTRIVFDGVSDNSSFSIRSDTESSINSGVVTYFVKDDTVGQTLPVISGVSEGWKCYSVLNFIASKDSPQALNEDHEQQIILHYNRQKNNETVSSSKIIHSFGNTEVQLSTSRPVSVLGGESIDVTSVSETGDIEYLSVYTFDDNPSSATPATSNRFDTTIQLVPSTTTSKYEAVVECAFPTGYEYIIPMSLRTRCSVLDIVDGSGNSVSTITGETPLTPKMYYFRVDLSEYSSSVATVKYCLSAFPYVNWTSSNPHIAEVDESGKVLAKSVGSCTIRAMLGREEVSSIITVGAGGASSAAESTGAASSLQISPSSATLSVGEQLSLQLVVSDAAISEKAPVSVVFHSPLKVSKNDNTDTILGLLQSNTQSNYLFDYAHVISSDDVIMDPYDPSSFTKRNHPYNPFTICQWDLTNIKTDIVVSNNVKGY